RLGVIAGDIDLAGRISGRQGAVVGDVAFDGARAADGFAWRDVEGLPGDVDKALGFDVPDGSKRVEARAEIHERARPAGKRGVARAGDGASDEVAEAILAEAKGDWSVL